MKKFNKMLAVLLSLMMCLGMVSPAFAHVVAIDGATESEIVRTVQEGVDKISGSESKSGTITMTEDETTDSTITIGSEDYVSDTRVDVTLNLNGNNLTGEGDVISVEENASLTINGGEAEPDEPAEADEPETPAETDEGGEDEPETPAETPKKNTITGDVENKGKLTVNQTRVDGNVRNSGEFYLNDSEVTKTVYKSEGSTFESTNSTVDKEGTLGFYGNGGKYTLEDAAAGGGKKVTIYPDSTTKVSETWLRTNGLSNDNVTEVVIADGVTTIGKNAFDGCAGLTKVTIPGSVTSIEQSAFQSCAGLTEVTIGNGVKTIGDRAFEKCTSLTEVTIPGSVETIGEFAFQSCDGLTSVTIGNGVETIENDAFGICSSLESVTIPDSVKTIGERAFQKCSRLTSVTIPDGVETIGASAFFYCTGLTEVTIPDGVETIGASAFFYCTGLTEVTIPDGVETIGASAFFYCTGLTSVTIPDGASIGDNAFYYCTGLTSVTIPADASIGAGAFDGCTPHCVIRSSDGGETVTYYLNGAEKFDYSQDVNDFCGSPSVTQKADGTVVVNSDDEKAEIKAVNGNKPVIMENDNGSITVTAGCKRVTVDKEGRITRGDLGHKEVTDEAVKPTCTKTGLTEGKHCSVCGEVITAQTVIAAEAHTEEIDEAVKPTCTTTGLTEGKYCSVCGEVITAQTVIAAEGHTYGDWTVTTEATATKDGEKTRSCTVCGHTETEVTPATGNGNNNPGDGDNDDNGNGDTVIDTPNVPLGDMPETGTTQIEDETVPLAAGPVTRAEFIDYLWRHEGRPASNGVCTFIDVAEDHEYTLALAWAEQNGIIEANEDGSFEPDELVTVVAVRDILDNFARVFEMDVDVTALASLTGEDDEAVLNCDEVIAEFFRKETEEQKAA